MIAIFSRYREYIVVKIATHFTPYLIESTLELLESTGVEFMHTCPISVHEYCPVQFC